MEAISLGALLGPVLGGGLYDIAGFQLTCDVVAGISLFFTAIYFFLVFIQS